MCDKLFQSFLLHLMVFITEWILLEHHITASKTFLSSTVERHWQPQGEWRHRHRGRTSNSGWTLHVRPPGHGHSDRRKSEKQTTWLITTDTPLCMKGWINRRPLTQSFCFRWTSCWWHNLSLAAGCTLTQRWPTAAAESHIPYPRARSSAWESIRLRWWLSKHLCFNIKKG